MKKLILALSTAAALTASTQAPAEGFRIAADQHIWGMVCEGRQMLAASTLSTQLISIPGNVTYGILQVDSLPTRVSRSEPSRVSSTGAWFLSRRSFRPLPDIYLCAARMAESQIKSLSET
jgi:hypothetical protein